jgi:hypothetical protein
VQSVSEAGGDTEVAAAAAERPEQIGVLLRVGSHEPAVGRDELGGQQVVDREPVLSHEVADAVAEGEPADPDGASVEANREAVRSESARHLARGHAGEGDRVPVQVRLVDVAALRRRSPPPLSPRLGRRRGDGRRGRGGSAASRKRLWSRFRSQIGLPPSGPRHSSRNKGDGP